MAYNTIIQLASSPSLMARIAAAAADEGQSDPVGWTAQRAWEFAASPGWADAWQFAEDNATVNVNPDTGVRDDVINDTMILGAVQAIIATEAGP